MDLIQVSRELENFIGESLTRKISLIEDEFKNKSVGDNIPTLGKHDVTESKLKAAVELKQIAGQVNVVIHTLGILMSLPYITQSDEIIQSLSLGAGNTVKGFDLETNKQIAEFKFIHWRGGSESERQNILFKDFFYLAESPTHKYKKMYLIGKEIPLKFFNGKRSLNSIMSKNSKVKSSFFIKYNDSFQVVRDYYCFKEKEVEIVDLLKVLPQSISCLF